MIKIILTIDYEIFGNGDGDLKKLIVIPANKLLESLNKYGWKFVNFVEVAELIKFKQQSSIFPAYRLVEEQIEFIYSQNHEIALHLHPQWFNAVYNENKWLLDYSEYNICNLPETKINSYIKESIEYLRNVIGCNDFSPTSFRAGNWLLQPTDKIYNVLLNNNFSIDSSVFKGGKQSSHQLNYMHSLKNGFFWKFKDDVNVSDTNGKLIEIPIYTRQVPFWKMLSTKRKKIFLESEKHSSVVHTKFNKIRDKLRFFYPQKFDISKMTLKELIKSLDYVLKIDLKTPEIMKPIVIIGHTKNLMDFETINKFFAEVNERELKICTFNNVLNDLNND